MNEKPFFFENDNYRLFGVLHAPESSNKGYGFIFCHPFAEEKLWAHRVYVHFARDLCALGYHVLRFDFMGHGDSDGDFRDSDIKSQLSDIKCAKQTLKQNCPELKSFGILGLRLGASLAALAAESDPEFDRLILWDPIVDGNKYIQMALRANLTAQMAEHKKIVSNREQLIAGMKQGQPVNLEGYELSYNYFEQTSGINLLNATKKFTGRCFITQIGREGQPLHRDLLQLQSLYTYADISHATEQPFWKEIKQFYERANNLFATTLEWLEK
jgi:exosortase A-associated hydrolase 2